jgi:hypothetical protein
VLAGLDTAAFAAESRGEPLVVLTHSMGGQIFYDLVTHFLPRMPEHRGIRIDYWCAAASQVGLFEELGLFLESAPERGPGPAAHPPREHLGGWSSPKDSRVSCREASDAFDVEVSRVRRPCTDRRRRPPCAS